MGRGCLGLPRATRYIRKAELRVVAQAHAFRTTPSPRGLPASAPLRTHRKRRVLSSSRMASSARVGGSSRRRNRLHPGCSVLSSRPLTCILQAGGGAGRKQQSRFDTFTFRKMHLTFWPGWGGGTRNLSTHPMPGPVPRASFSWSPRFRKVILVQDLRRAARLCFSHVLLDV